jgi:hypothetical protein
MYNSDTLINCQLFYGRMWIAYVFIFSRSYSGWHIKYFFILSYEDMSFEMATNAGSKSAVLPTKVGCCEWVPMLVPPVHGFAS